MPAELGRKADSAAASEEDDAVDAAVAPEAAPPPLPEAVLPPPLPPVALSAGAEFPAGAAFPEEALPDLVVRRAASGTDFSKSLI